MARPALDRRLTTAAGAVVVVVAAVAGFLLLAPRVETSADGSGASTISIIGPGRDVHVSASLGPICVARADRLAVTGVRAVDATGGLRVVDFRIYSPPTFGQPGIVTKPINEVAAYNRRASRYVDESCASGKERQMVAVEVLKPAASLARAADFEVTYRWAGLTRRARLGVGVDICESRSDQGCS